MWLDVALAFLVIGAYFLGVHRERQRWIARARTAFSHKSHVSDFTGRGNTT